MKLWTPETKMEAAEKEVWAIDRNLKLEEIFPTGSGANYRVSSKGRTGSYVLKTHYDHISSHSPSFPSERSDRIFPMILNEYKSLFTLRGLEGFPLLEKGYYANGGLQAFTKEYIEGITLLENGFVVEENQREQLERLVKSAHKKGVALRDISPENFVFSANDGVPHMADVGYSVFRDDMSEEDFAKFKTWDLKYLREDIFGERPERLTSCL